MKTRTVLFFTFFSFMCFGQNTAQSYSKTIKTADSLYRLGAYKSAAISYSTAFKITDVKALSNDIYNAACSWALAGFTDSAFFYLNQVTTLMDYTNYVHIALDQDLVSLYEDQRWQPLLERVLANKDKQETSMNKSLVKQLEAIYVEDQKYRRQINKIESRYGLESKEMKTLWKIINEKDSINLIAVKAILNKYGWLGVETVGISGNSVLFLVIQHANTPTQEQFLPMLQDAVKTGKAFGRQLALLEDRLLLAQGKKQIYGSQLAKNPETQLYYVLPLEDPDNVDKRRREVGLPALAEYMREIQERWNMEQSKDATK